MATNSAAAYGRDLKCFDDADAIFSSVQGIAVVAQSAYHRLTNDTVLGKGGADWGFNVIRLCGMSMARLAGQQPLISAALQKDPRIRTAEVSLQPIPAGAGLWRVILTVTCITALGPFTLILGINDATVAILEGDDS